MTDKEIYQKEAARDILSKIDEVCFSSAFVNFRVSQGHRGQIEFIKDYIKNKYNIK